LPSKSSYKRRGISPKSKTESGISEKSPISKGVIISSGEPNKSDISLGTELKSFRIAKTDDSYAIQETKWIGLVAVIILVLLGISYVLFH
jgi:hypothetical protein